MREKYLFKVFKIELVKFLLAFLACSKMVAFAFAYANKLLA